MLILALLFITINGQILKKVSDCMSACQYCNLTEPTKCIANSSLITPCDQGYVYNKTVSNCVLRAPFQSNFTNFQFTQQRQVSNMQRPDTQWRQGKVQQCSYKNSKGITKYFDVIGLFKQVQGISKQFLVSEHHETYIFSFNLVRNSWTPHDHFLIIDIESGGQKLSSYEISYQTRQSFQGKSVISCQNQTLVTQKFNIKINAKSFKYSKIKITFTGFLFTSIWGVTNINFIPGCQKFSIYNKLTGGCDFCDMGYFPFNERMSLISKNQLIRCQKCAYQCNHCMNSTFCYSCIKGYKLVSFKCVPDDEFTKIQIIQTTNSEQKTCKVMNFSFFINSQKSFIQTTNISHISNRRFGNSFMVFEFIYNTKFYVNSGRIQVKVNNIKASQISQQNLTNKGFEGCSVDSIERYSIQKFSVFVGNVSQSMNFSLRLIGGGCSECKFGFAKLMLVYTEDKSLLQSQNIVSGSSNTDLIGNNNISSVIVDTVNSGVNTQTIMTTTVTTTSQSSIQQTGKVQQSVIEVLKIQNITVSVPVIEQKIVQNVIIQNQTIEIPITNKVLINQNSTSSTVVEQKVPLSENLTNAISLSQIASAQNLRTQQQTTIIQDGRIQKPQLITVQQVTLTQLNNQSTTQSIISSISTTQQQLQLQQQQQQQISNSSQTQQQPIVQPSKQNRQNTQNTQNKSLSSLSLQAMDILSFSRNGNNGMIIKFNKTILPIYQNNTKFIMQLISSTKTTTKDNLSTNSSQQQHVVYKSISHFNDTSFPLLNNNQPNQQQQQTVFAFYTDKTYISDKATIYSLSKDNVKTQIVSFSIQRTDFLDNKAQSLLTAFKELFHSFAWFIIIVLFIAILTAKVYLLQQTLQLMQCCLFCVYIFTSYLPGSIINTISGLRRLQNLDFLPENFIQTIQNFLLGDLVQQSPLRFTLFHKDINFIRGIIPIIILLLIISIWFLLIVIYDKNTRRQGEQQDQDGIYGDNIVENSLRFGPQNFIQWFHFEVVRKIARNKLDYWIQVLKIIYLSIMFMAFKQFNNFAYPDSHGGQVINILFCLVIFLATIGLLVAAVVICQKKYYKLEYGNFLSSYPSIYYKKIPKNCLPTQHHLIYNPLLKIFRPILFCLLVALAGNYPIPIFILMLILNIGEILFAWTHDIYQDSLYMKLLIVQSAIFTTMLMIVMIISCLAGVISTDGYLAFGYVFMAFGIVVIINGIARSGYLIVDYVQKQMEVKEKAVQSSRIV